MNKSAFIGGFMGSLTFWGWLYIYFRFIHKKSDEEEEESFWESRQFEDSLEKADDLCEVGYNFQRNEIIYKKISQKKWLAEILTPDDNQFETGCELTIENYVYTKIGEKCWTIERAD